MAVTYDRSGLSNFDYPFGILLRLCVFTFWVPFCHVRYDFRINMMFGHPLLPVVCRTHVLFTLFVFVCVYWCPTHIVLCFCFVFLLLVANFSGLSVVDYPFVILQFLWIVRFWLPFRYSPVSLDCPLLITLSLFSDVFSVHKRFWNNFIRYVKTICLEIQIIQTYTYFISITHYKQEVSVAKWLMSLTSDHKPSNTEGRMSPFIYLKF